MKTHKFDVEDAKKHGVEKAILLEHLKFHQEANSNDERFIIDGKPHATLPPDTAKKMYPYLNYKSISRWLNELEEEGVVTSCKPRAKHGDHTKCYHVLECNRANSQNEISNSQNESIGKSQNENSSIVTNVDNHMKESVVEKLKVASTLKDLLSIWESYRRSKNKYMTLFERDVLFNSTWKGKDVEQVKDSILYTIENGWLTLQEKEGSEKEPSSAEFRKRYNSKPV